MNVNISPAVGLLLVFLVYGFAAIPVAYLTSLCFPHGAEVTMIVANLLIGTTQKLPLVSGARL